MRGARQAPAELHRHAAPLRSPAAFHLVHRGHGDGAATNTASRPHEVKGNASLALGQLLWFYTRSDNGLRGVKFGGGLGWFESMQLIRDSEIHPGTPCQSSGRDEDKHPSSFAEVK